MRIAIAAGVVSGLVFGGATRAADAPRPNVVVLLADDLGYGETGAQGNPGIPTPNIDAIAAGGVRCTAGYVTASFCAPSRAGLLSGRYQTRFGFENNPVGAKNAEPGVGLPAAEFTFAERLRDAGYATALVGKWHLGGTAAFHPQRHGFDEFFGFLHEGHYYAPESEGRGGIVSHLRRRTLPSGSREGNWISADGGLILATGSPYDEPPYDADNPILRGGQPVVEEDYLTDALTREAVGFIGRNRDRPFFLYVAYNAVHSPMQAKREDFEASSGIDDPHRRVFAGMLRGLDRSVGDIVAALRKIEPRRETLIVFLSDNGGPTAELTSGNGPLRDGKGSVYEGGLRVPFLLRWDGRLPAGAAYAQPVSSLDILPTALAAAGVETDDARLDGVDLVPYLNGTRPGPPHEALYWRMGGKAALRHGDWKIVRPRDGRSAWELYDLAADVGETRNLAADRPETVRDLVGRWTDLDGQMVPPRF